MKMGLFCSRLLIATFALGAGVLATNTAIARPYTGERMNLAQPDGTKVAVVLWGDEFFMRAESVDGYSLVVDPSGYWICYGALDATGKLVSTGYRYNGGTIPANALRSVGGKKGLRSDPKNVARIIQQTKAQLSPPSLRTSAAARKSSMEPVLQGAITGLVVVVDFPDRAADVSKEEIEAAFNGDSYDPENVSGDSRGSIRSWSETISYGKSSVQHQVLGYYQAAHPTKWYKRGGTWDYSGADDLKAEVYAYIDANIDLRQLGVVNGELRSLAILYAGDVVANGWANSLWPHASGASYLTDEGVYINRHFMSNIGSSLPLNLGTARHELGHSFFNWPDTYDYDGDSASGGGYAMESDLPSGVLRMWAGWMNVVDVSGSSGTYTLKGNGDTVYRYTNPANESEYFVVDYLRKQGWNSNAPDEGLIVWHVDEHGNHDWQQRTPELHYQLSVEQADGRYDLENNCGSRLGDLFRAGYRTRFDSTTVPDSNWWDVTPSGFRIWGVGVIGDTITFNVGEGGGDELDPTSDTGLVIAAHAQKCLDIYAGNTDDGGAAVLWGCNDATNQQFTFESVGRNTYNLRNVNSSKCLAVANSSTADLAVVDQRTCSTDANQRWEAIDAGNGRVKLRAQHSEKCLQVADSRTDDGATFQQSNCDSGTDQQFIVPSGVTASSPPPAQTEPCTPAATVCGGWVGNFGSGPYCFRTPDDIQGWGCSTFDGRTIEINDSPVSCGGVLPVKYNGYYYFDISAGMYSWASLYWWGPKGNCPVAAPSTRSVSKLTEPLLGSTDFNEEADEAVGCSVSRTSNGSFGGFGVAWVGLGLALAIRRRRRG
jgi:M6 family metalloprotease-like protein/MYXO-CTERM domain-containing protein